MTELSRILNFIDACEDIDQLKQMVKNAKRQRNIEIENAAMKRLASVQSFDVMDALGQELWKTIYILEQMLTSERGRTTRLSRTRQKLTRATVKETLEGWAEGNATQGFHMLIDRGMPELTGEAIILRHAHEFKPRVVDAAAQRLKDAGIDPKSVAADIGDTIACSPDAAKT